MYYLRKHVRNVSINNTRFHYPMSPIYIHVYHICAICMFVYHNDGVIIMDQGISYMAAVLVYWTEECIDHLLWYHWHWSNIFYICGVTTRCSIRRAQISWLRQIITPISPSVSINQVCSSLIICINECRAWWWKANPKCSGSLPALWSG